MGEADPAEEREAAAWLDEAAEAEAASVAFVNSKPSG